MKNFVKIIKCKNSNSTSIFFLLHWALREKRKFISFSQDANEPLLKRTGKKNLRYLSILQYLCVKNRAEFFFPSHKIKPSTTDNIDSSISEKAKLQKLILINFVWKAEKWRILSASFHAFHNIFQHWFFLDMRFYFQNKMFKQFLFW